MTCLKPIRIFKNLSRIDFPDGLVVPCGKCIACRIKKREEWASRLIQEVGYHEKSSFITLTYQDAFLPAYNSLRIKDLQLFFKRLRKRFSTGSIKYFASGEYGDDTDRPHYHAILFGVGLSPNDKIAVLESWSKGFVKYGLAEPDSIRYVSKYIEKKYDGELADELYISRHREKPFKVSSNGLGGQYVIDNKEQLQENLYMTVRGVKQSIPRYYINKAELNIEPIRDKADELSKQRIERFTGVAELTQDEAFQYLSRAEKIKLKQEIIKGRTQREKNLQAKINLKTLRKKHSL